MRTPRFASWRRAWTRASDGVPASTPRINAYTRRRARAIVLDAVEASCLAIGPTAASGDAAAIRRQHRFCLQRYSRTSVGLSLTGRERLWKFGEVAITA